MWLNPNGKHVVPLLLPRPPSVTAVVTAHTMSGAADGRGGAQEVISAVVERSYSIFGGGA